MALCLTKSAWIIHQKSEKMQKSSDLTFPSLPLLLEQCQETTPTAEGRKVKNHYYHKTTESSKTSPAKRFGKGSFLKIFNVFHELVGIKAGTELTRVVTRSSAQPPCPVEIQGSEFHHNPSSVF